MNSTPVAKPKLQCMPPYVGCGREIDEEEYWGWDIKTRKQFTLTNICNTCQVRIVEELEADNARG